MQLLRGVEYLHTQQPPVLHRDLKSSNLFLRRGDVTVGDIRVRVSATAAPSPPPPFSRLISARCSKVSDAPPTPSAASQVLSPRPGTR